MKQVYQPLDMDLFFLIIIRSTVWRAATFVLPGIGGQSHDVNCGAQVPLSAKPA